MANTNDPEVTLVNQGGQRVLIFGRNFFSPRETTIKRFQVADTVTWIRGAHSLKTGFDLQPRPASSTSSPATSAAATPSTRWPASAAACPTAPARPSSRTSRARAPPGAETQPDINEYAALPPGRVAGLAQDVTADARPALRPAGLRAARGAQPRPAAGRGRHRHQLPQRPTRTTSRPRLGLAWNAERADGGARRLRPLLRPHAVDHGRHRPLEQRRQRDPVTFTGSAGAHLPEPSSPRRPTGRRRLRPSIFVLRPGLREPRGAPGERGRRARARRTTWRVGGQLPVRGRAQAAALARLQRRRRRCPPRSRSRAAARSPCDRFPTARPFSQLRPHRPLREHGRVELQRRAPLELQQALPRRPAGEPRLHAGQGRGHQARRRPRWCPGGGDDAQVPLEPVGPRRRPRRRATTTCATAPCFSGVLGHPATCKDSAGVAQGAARRLVARAGSPPCRAGCPTRSASTTTSTTTATAATTSCPAAATATACPRSKNIDLRLSRRIPLGTQARLELIARGLQPAQQHEHHARSSDASTTSRHGVLVPQLNLSNPRLELRRRRGRRRSTSRTRSASCRSRRR